MFLGNGEKAFGFNKLLPSSALNCGAGNDQSVLLLVRYSADFQSPKCTCTLCRFTGNPRFCILCFFLLEMEGNLLQLTFVCTNNNNNDDFFLNLMHLRTVCYFLIPHQHNV